MIKHGDMTAERRMKLERVREIKSMRIRMVTCDGMDSTARHATTESWVQVCRVWDMRCREEAGVADGTARETTACAHK